MPRRPSPRSKARSTCASTASPCRADALDERLDRRPQRRARRARRGAARRSASAGSRSPAVEPRPRRRTAPSQRPRLAAAQRAGRAATRSAGEALERLVVQLARPAAALLLGRLDALPQALAPRPTARSRPRSPRSPRTPRAGRSSSRSNAAVAAERSKAAQHAERAAAEDERDEQRRSRRRDAGAPSDCVSTSRRRRRSARRVRAQHAPATVVSIGQPLAEDVAQLAGAGRDDEVASASSRSTSARAPTSARPRFTISSRTRSRSVSPPSARAIADGRLEPADGPLELVAALVRRLRRGGRSRSRSRPSRRGRRRLLVGVGELLAVLLLGQVEVAPDLAADHHRHAEERLSSAGAPRGKP